MTRFYIIIAAVILALFAVGLVLWVAILNSKNATETATFHATATAVALSNSARSGTATATSRTAATTVALADPYPDHNGHLSLYDPLEDNSRGLRWDEVAIANIASCGFVGASYHMFESRHMTFHACAASTTNFDNFAYEVEMTVLKGDCGGLIFRGDNPQAKFYIFEVCENGTYGFAVANGSSGKYLITHTTNKAIKMGLSQTNVIAVVANSNTIHMYVNDIAIDSITDNTFSKGQIGLLANNFNGPTEVAYANVKVWTL